MRGKSDRRMKSLVAVLIASSMWLPANAFAQEEASPQAGSDDPKGDIVVTAQRRGESLQDVPISITAVSAENLEKQGVKDIADIARIVPGVELNLAGNNRTAVSIRGIRATSGSSTTGIYIDDVAIQSRIQGYGGGNAYPRLFDVERIEALRGPQATLFGAGSQGGTIRFISPAPSLTDYSGMARAEIASTQYGAPSYELGAAFGGPIVEDRIAARGSIWYRRDGGYIDRFDYNSGTVTDKNANSADALSAKLELALALTDAITIRPAIYYQEENSDDLSEYSPHLSDPERGVYRLGHLQPSPSHDRFYIPSLKIEGDLGDVSVVSITSWLDRRNRSEIDYNSYNRGILLRQWQAPPGARGRAIFDNYQRAFSQELRLQSTSSAAPLQWVVGLYYQNSRQNYTQVIEDPTLPAEFEAATGIPLASVLGPLVNGTILYDQDPFLSKDEQIAVFGQADWRVLDRLTLTAGMRYAKTKVSIEAGFVGPYAGGAAYTDRGQQKENPFTPRFGAKFDIDDDNNIYTTVSKGFRVGGYNPRQFAVCRPQLVALGLGDINPAEYDSDVVWNYEVGSKNRLLDRRLTLNSSAYVLKWKNIQQPVTLTCGGNFLDNLGSATIKGFDVQAQLRPVDALSIGLSVAYTHAKFDKTVFVSETEVPGTQPVTKDDRLQGPPWRVTADIQYDFPVSGRESYVRADYQYSSSEPDSVYTNNPLNGLSFVNGYYVQKPIHFVSVRAGTQFDKLAVSLFVDNVFNETTPLSQGRSAPGVVPIIYRASGYRPRTVGLTATYRY